MTGKVMVEAFRESTPHVMPEIQAGIQMLLNTVDPGLKIAGVTNKGQ